MSKPVSIGVLFCLLLLSTGFGTILPAQLQLYQSTRTTGSIQELDLNTGNILATNVGGFTNARGMDFSPLGGLFVCHGNSISRLDNPAVAPVVQLSFLTENPHDICFDALGNMYVVTETQVHAYNTALASTLSFPHGLTTVTGDGNSNKGWGIEVNPANGEIFVVGRQGLRRFDPVTGALLGSIPNSSPNGFPCLKFTASNFNNAFLYVGSVISGVDQVRVYDSNLNFLRVFWPTHNGNPIDFEVHPITQDLYLFNTVTSNPTNRYNASESLVAGWATFGNPSRGSALGDINGVVLPEFDLGLEVEDLGEQVVLRWKGIEGGSALRYFVERETAGDRLELGWLTGAAGAGEVLEIRDDAPLLGGSRYHLRAVDQNGAVIAEEVVVLERSAGEELFLGRNGDAAWVHARSQGIEWMEAEMRDLDGRLLMSFEGAAEVRVDLAGLSAGIYLLDVRAYRGNRLSARQVFKLRKNMVEN